MYSILTYLMIEKRDCPNKCSLFETSVIFLRKLSIQSEKDMLIDEIAKQILDKNK